MSEHIISVGWGEQIASKLRAFRLELAATEIVPPRRASTPAEPRAPYQSSDETREVIHAMIKEKIAARCKNKKSTKTA